ncbi:ATP-binding protein [Caulobacter flavus]|uniref:ATP-binding protein n=1 Tax=Caulobacter flavus TaxID=1679497 RepID=A0A2N5CLV9_9CAUL|nr:ATP-binding cassette domain-containing protein [Caulobacter flavus]AYV48174.1 ATP-binding protein [Caulobacter flavus]PLR06901.1 ATP-binding protein [Caulobacter flavus]
MIKFDRVSKNYKGRNLSKTVLDDVDLVITPGDALGICGANGAGKSTLLRLIAGVEHPSSGSIRRDMSVSWPIGYTSCFQSSLTGADNARFIARIYRQPVEPLLAFVEDFAQLGPYLRQPVKTYSAGMQARLAFGISLAVDFDCYLIDEVTGAGDERFRERCRDALIERRRTGAMIMVSHHPETLMTYCTRGAVLKDGKLSFHDRIEDAIEAHQRLQAEAA